MKERIVITGMGAVTPIGIGVPEYWTNLIAGKCGIGPITKFDTENLAVKVAGEVHLDPEAYLPKKLVREMPEFMQYAYIAGEEALTDSGMEIDPLRTGIVMGTALSGISVTAKTQDEMTRGLHRRVGPRFLPEVLGNIACAQLSIAHNIQGPSMTVSTACSSGGDAVSVAAMFLRSGMADAVLAIGGESALCGVVASSLCSAQALSRQTDPALACCPFDAERNGFVMGEGGGALLLETLDHAKARGARIYGELLGFANNTDAHHVTAPRPDGSCAAMCMAMAMASAGLTPDQIGYINAHGTSTHAGDAAECQAVRTVFGPYVDRVAVSSTKAATGHLMGAGGLTEAIACIQAIREGILPPTLHFRTPDPACGLDCVPNTARQADITAAMTNSFGFGGQNSSLIFGKYQED